MSPARAAAYLVSAILFAGWLASAAGVVRPRTIRIPRPSEDNAQLDAVASDVQSQAVRLRQRLASAPAPQSPTRNPFSFVERELPAPRAAVTRAPAPPPVIEPERTPAEPELVLLGVAEQGTTRTAMIGSGEELLMATEGQPVAGRYRVGKVAPDAVELIDVLTGAIRRLYLKSPV